MKVTINDFWYDSPKRKDGGRWRLGLHIDIEGIGSIHFYLDVAEMKEVLAELRDHNAECNGEPSFKNPARHKNKAWWAYECVALRDGVEDKGLDQDANDYCYNLAGQDVEDVPVCLYRDDHMSVYLPHQVGEEIVEIIEQRLVLAGESFQQRVA